MSKDIKTYLKQQEIKHHNMVPYTLEKNGVAERKKRSPVEIAKSMLPDAGFPNKFWAEAIIMTSTYLQNKVPSKAIKYTPYKM